MRYFIDRQVTIKRVRSVGSTNRSVVSATATAVPTHIQNVNPGKTQFEAGSIGKTFRGWFPLAELPIPTLRPGDKVVQTKGPDTSDGHTYMVASVKVVDFGSTQYIECELVEEDRG